MRNKPCWVILLGIFSLQALWGQRATMDEVRLFQTFFRDAAVSQVIYGEGRFSYLDFDFVDVIDLRVNAGFPVTPELEIATGLGFINRDPQFRESESGISDLLVLGKYHLRADRTQFAPGVYLTLPIGEEAVGQGNFDFGFFGSLRHPASERVVLSGTVSLDFLETGNDHDASVLLAGGIIYKTNASLSIVSELDIHTEGDVALFTAGLDYRANPHSHLRSALGVGLDDGAPDIALLLSFVTFF